MAHTRKARNIYIIGAQSTGKTTLVTALTKWFTFGSAAHSPPTVAPCIIREVARTVLKEHSFKAEDIRASSTKALDLQRLILKAQAEAESNASKTGNWFISDRSGLDCLIYAQLYAGNDAVAGLLQGEDWKACQQSLREARIFVCEPGAQWLLDDGTRLMPLDDEEWFKTHDMFCQFLKKLDLSYTVVPRDLEDIDERVNLVLAEQSQSP
jgi:predicted ATPase